MGHSMNKAQNFLKKLKTKHSLAKKALAAPADELTPAYVAKLQKDIDRIRDLQDAALKDTHHAKKPAYIVHQQKTVAAQLAKTLEEAKRALESGEGVNVQIKGHKARAHAAHVSRVHDWYKKIQAKRASNPNHPGHKLWKKQQAAAHHKKHGKHASKAARAAHLKKHAKHAHQAKQ